MNKPTLVLADPLPDSLVVGSGQYQLIRGEITGVRNPEISLIISPDCPRECTVEVFSGNSDEHCEFLITILWRPEDVGSRSNLEILLSSDADEPIRHTLGELELLANSEAETAAAPRMGDKPLVAICMATYNPDMDRLTRQVESILCQSYRNWLLIISDDASQTLDENGLDALCRLDPGRIRLYRHQQNLGFYHNFERSLSYLPGNAELVAFSDQDDVWYPEKLRILVDEMEKNPEVILAYSDMRIVDAGSRMIADSYWQNRRNEYRDLAAVLLANTVTGAASIFRRELLRSALPFPSQLGSSYHDHWLACTALSIGKMHYIAEPLYDYMQYPDSVLGHQNEVSAPLVDQLSAHLQENDSKNKWQAVYRRDCLRLQLMARTLQVRLPGRKGSAALRLMEGGRVSTLRLLWAYCMNRLSRRTTNKAELWLAMAFIHGQGRKSDCRRTA